MNYFNKSNYTKYFSKKLIDYFTKDKVDLIIKVARYKYKLLLRKIDKVSHKQRKHVYGCILSLIAIYQSIIEFNKIDAMKIVEETCKARAISLSEKYNKLTKNKLLNKKFFIIFKKGFDMNFSSKCGFDFELLSYDKNNNIKFNINGCPYVKYCKELKMKELTHVFCLNDIYCYSQIEIIDFKREHSLGIDSNPCDFSFVRKENI